MTSTVSTLFVLTLAITIGTPLHAQEGSSRSSTATDAEERIQELEEKVAILAEEIEGRRREGIVSGEYEYEPMRGVGPAGAKIYAVEQGLSIGGYGQAFYRDSSIEGQDEADFIRQIFYFGYRFNDWILLNTEVEFEHVDEVFLEFAYLDFLLHEKANVRAGLILTPLGLINEVHEPTTFFGNIRPEVEKRIIPTTSRENGVGLYGNLTENLEYRLYVQNSFASIDDTGQSNIAGANLRGIRQKGSEAEADNLAVTGRIDWTPMTGVLVGGSFWTGKTGQDKELFDATTSASLGSPSVGLDIYEVHGQYRRHGLWLRGLFAQANIDDADELSRSLAGDNVGETMTGWYVEAGYDIMPMLADLPNQSLFPWIRYSQLDTQDDMPSGFSRNPANDREVITAGLHYVPHPNVVVKAEFKSFDSDASGDENNNQDEILLGIGYNF